MAVQVLQRWTDLHIHYILGASGSITPPASWQVALCVNTVVSITTRAPSWNSAGGAGNVQEIAGTTAAGYARQAVARTINQAGIDWGTPTFDSTLASPTGGTTSVADQVTFGAFTGAGPSPNGAQSVAITDGSTLNAGQLYMIADTAVLRTYAVGDTEKVTATIKSS